MLTWRSVNLTWYGAVNDFHFYLGLLIPAFIVYANNSIVNVKWQVIKITLRINC